MVKSTHQLQLNELQDDHLVADVQSLLSKAKSAQLEALDGLARDATVQVTGDLLARRNVGLGQALLNSQSSF